MMHFHFNILLDLVSYIVFKIFAFMFMSKIDMQFFFLSDLGFVPNFANPINMVCISSFSSLWNDLYNIVRTHL